ncbi:MAG: PQQ-binding-like beta-propeller repeat protein, partial [Myxococcota bacterium]
MKRLAILGVLLLGACAGRTLETHAEPGGNLLVLTAKQGERADKRAARSEAGALVVLVERTRLRAIDPSTAGQVWTSSVDVAGHAAASDTAVFVPLRGHRLAAIDRTNGQRLWTVELPGEALSGLSANETTVVATVVDHDKGRTRAVGMAAIDGQVRWVRRSEDRLGAPAVVGRVALVPVGNQIVALGTGTGRERARLDLGGGAPQGDSVEPAVERIVRTERGLLAGSNRSWVDLYSSTAGELDALRDIEGYGEVFARDEGLDAGHTDAERLKLWVDLSPTTAGHRNAVFVCRRAVVALRVDDGGTPSAAQWTYLSDHAEFVAMDVRDDRVVLVREDGVIVQLSRGDGSELDRIKGAGVTRGALMLDLPARVTQGRAKKPDAEQKLAMIRDLILDPDPRLLPAQQLAVELLWRDDDATIRGAVAK